jgi:hypothetical protein
MAELFHLPNCYAFVSAYRADRARLSVHMFQLENCWMEIGMMMDLKHTYKFCMWYCL